MTATSTDCPLQITPEIEKIIFDAMRSADVDRGIGYLDAEDVVSHLQLAALQAIKRFDPARGASIKTFLWTRLRGEAVELVRVHGSRKRTGTPRPPVLSLERSQLRSQGAQNKRWQGATECETPDPTDEISDFNAGADLVLAVSRLPTKMRLVLALLFYEGLTVSAAAGRLRQPEETVRALRDGAVGKLRLALTSTPLRSETRRYGRPNGSTPPAT